MNKELPFISILVMSYNQESFIGDCVDSVLCQEYDGELEFIFCDDNSSDSTFEIIREKVCQYTGKRRIITYKAPENGKVAVNMNIAVSLSKGDWLMRVDGDDILHPDRTRLSALAITKFPNSTAISGALVPFTDTYTPVQNVKDNDMIFNKYNINDVSENSIPDGLEWWGGTMCMSRRLFTVFGKMPVECYTLDDTMFASRAIMLGDIIIIKNAVLLYYRRHGSNISSDNNTDNLSLFQLMAHDYKTRNYYQRGITSHKPILNEIAEYSKKYPEYQKLYNCFKKLFSELERQAYFWKKSWLNRINDAHIQGSFWKKIPWAIRVMCPLTYAFVAKYMKKS